MKHTAKEWKSYDEQIELLRSRGMIIDNEGDAKHFLQRVGYYRLSGYWYPFREFDADKKMYLDSFVEETYFSDVIALYTFDRKLRLLALDAIERIELAIQVKIAHLLGARDIFAHESPKQLHGSFVRLGKHGGLSLYKKWHKDYDRLIDRSKRKPFVKHNLKKYGKLPIWVAIEIFDFGTMSKLYAGMKIKDKIEIERQFGLNEGKHFQTWLRGFNFIRNTAAHHSRLWNCNVLETASIPRTKIKLSNLKNSKPFMYFCMMQMVLKVVSSNSNWGNEFVELMDNFPISRNEVISIQGMGAEDGWKDWDLWQK